MEEQAKATKQAKQDRTSQGRRTALRYICRKSDFIIKCEVFFRKTRANRILVKQCSGIIAHFDAQCNQKLRILIIERN